MIGKYVQYKYKPRLNSSGINQDTKRYLVVDFSPETDKYPAEIAIIQEFDYADISGVRQLKIWQKLSDFVVES